MSNLDDVKARLAAREELNRLLAQDLREAEAQVRRLLERIEALEAALEHIAMKCPSTKWAMVARRALDGD